MEANDFSEVISLDSECTALKSPKEVREGSHKLGSRLFKIFKSKNEHPLLKELEAYIAENKEVGNYAVIYSIVCFISGISLKEALTAFYFSTAAGIITNAVKLVPLGQIQGQEILFKIQDEIEDWVIEEFAKIGLDTARSILKQDVNDLVRRTDLEEETILDVMRILKEELDS